MVLSRNIFIFLMILVFITVISIGLVWQRNSFVINFNISPKINMETNRAVVNAKPTPNMHMETHKPVLNYKPTPNLRMKTTKATILQRQINIRLGLTKEEEKQFDVALKKAKTNKKIILEWYGANVPLKLTIGGNCGRCDVVGDRSMIDDNATGAVIFTYKQIKEATMPQKTSRRRDQLYIWQTGEAPPSLWYLNTNYLKFETKYEFNATMTYRRDSDVYQPYGNAFGVMLKKKKEGGLTNLSRILENKTRLSVAVMSNCHVVPGASIRLEFIKNLKEAGMKIETFGKCFNYLTYLKKEKEKFKKLLKSYKFYFAFENSYHCRDYITEKFFINGLEAGSVPIVWGAMKKDYEAVAPPGSFIYADDFTTARELINYVNYLDKNDTAYLEYFRWYKIHPSKIAGFGRQTRYCQLCRILHGINVDDVFSPSFNRLDHPRPLIDDKISYRRIPSLSRWYFKTETENCIKKVTQFYKDKLSLASRVLPKEFEGG